MKILLVLFGIVTLVVCWANGQSDGRYRPTTLKPIVNRIGDGRYQAINDGRYRPVNDGRYIPDDAGKYSHIDVGGGQYSGGGGQYTGGGGQYSGGGGQYSGGGGQYTGGGGGGGLLSGGRGQSTGSGSGRDQNRALTAVTSPLTKRITVAPPQRTGAEGWRILRDEKEEDQDGYHYLYETENQILAEEAGRIEQLSPTDEGLRSKGFYQYVGDDGVVYRVDYVADDNGFVPRGDHIPKVPPAIEKLLLYLATKAPDTNK